MIDRSINRFFLFYILFQEIKNIPPPAKRRNSITLLLQLPLYITLAVSWELFALQMIQHHGQKHLKATKLLMQIRLHLWLLVTMVILLIHTIMHQRLDQRTTHHLFLIPMPRNVVPVLIQELINVEFNCPLKNYWKTLHNLPLLRTNYTTPSLPKHSKHKDQQQQTHQTEVYSVVFLHIIIMLIIVIWPIQNFYLLTSSICSKEDSAVKIDNLIEIFFLSSRFVRYDQVEGFSWRRKCSRSVT